MQVIRTLWGNFSNFKNEIPSKPLYNEIVYTFEEENYKILSSMNYEVVLVKESKKNHTDWYLNKLILLEQALKTHNTFLFLDWDVLVLDPLILEKQTFSKKYNVPLYQYSPNYYKDVFKNQHTLTWFKNHEDAANILNVWKLADGSTVLPCFCFYYNDDQTTIPNLLEIANDYKFNTCSEEFSFFVYVRDVLDIKTVEDYISNIEPTYLYGRECDYVHRYLDYSYNTLNSTIDKLITKTIKFKHI